MKLRAAVVTLLVATLSLVGSVAYANNTDPTGGGHTGEFPCTNIKLSHQWERSCKGTTIRPGAKVNGIAYRVYPSRKVPGLNSWAELRVDLTDTRADGKCVYLRISTQVNRPLWLGTCGKGKTHRWHWTDGAGTGDWVRAFVCTGKNTTHCKRFWHQNMASAGPAGTF